MTLVNAPGAASSLVTTPATFGAVETLVNSLKIPAGSAQIGTSVVVDAFGTLSATAAGTLLARLRMGTAGTVADAQLCATPTVGSATVAVGWNVSGLFTVRTIGATGTIIGNGKLSVSANALGISAQTATVVFNSTIDEFLDLTLIGGGTTPVVTVIQSLIAIVKS